MHPCGRSLRQRLLLASHSCDDGPVEASAHHLHGRKQGLFGEKQAGGSSERSGSGGLALGHAGTGVRDGGPGQKAAARDEVAVLRSSVASPRGRTRHHDVELFIEWEGGARGGSLRSVWEDPSVTTVRALKNWEHLIGLLMESSRDLRIVWWGAPDHLPAPVYIAVNKHIAVVCFRGEDSSDLAVGSPFPSPHKAAGQQQNFQLPPSLWAAGEHLRQPERGRSAPYAESGGAWNGVTQSTPPPVGWQELGRRRNWGILPQDFVACHVSAPAWDSASAGWGQGVGGGRAAHAAMSRAADVSAAMDECKAWSLLKGREVLVVGHGLGGAAAHLWTLQSLSILGRPIYCKSFYSLALGPCMPADSVLASMVRGVCGVGETLISCSCSNIANSAGRMAFLVQALYRCRLFRVVSVFMVSFLTILCWSSL